MIGQTISHYVILEKLGSGGMGVVYKAKDIKLDRDVALKFLPHHISFNIDSKMKFIHEAKSISSLQHNNICTIHEINETDEGELFFSMELYQGETLKSKLDRESISIIEAVNISIQIAQGLKAAHDQGIIHRDIKPANIFITEEDTVKILDFGLAMDRDQIQVSPSELTTGTVAYMSPEQTRGKELDDKTDIWSLGVVIYEMITGQRPFEGNHEQAVVYSINNESLVPIKELVADVSKNMEQLIKNSLEKKQDQRYYSISELLNDLKKVQKRFSLEGIAKTETKFITQKLLTRPLIAIPGIIIFIMLFLFMYWFVDRNIKIRLATEEALPKIIDYVKKGNIVSAYYLAEEAEQYLQDNPMLAELWPRISDIRSIYTEPEGADIYFKEYFSIGGEYTYLGKSPIIDHRFPTWVFRWQLKKEGYQTKEIVTSAGIFSGGELVTPLRLTLNKLGSIPDNMIKIPSKNVNLEIIDFHNLKSIFVPEYLIDKYEVTNAQFKKFVDAGGYERREYWNEEFIKDSSSISWELALEEFRDYSGQLGPSTWVNGTYPEGEENHPVAGVSWYEALAYAEFVNRDLPTIYHWVNAASIASYKFIMPYSNFDSTSSAPVGSFPGIGFYGLYDMAGNVKEWVCNSKVTKGNMCYILGGSWADSPYMFTTEDARSRWNRLPDNGFRTVKYFEEEVVNDSLFYPIKHSFPEFDQTPVSDEEFQFYKDYLYNYEKTPLNANVDTVDESSPFWRREWITFDTPYIGDRIIAHLFIPKGFEPPFQTVVYWPGTRAQRLNSSKKITHDVGWKRNLHWQFLVMSGRAVLYPVYAGTYERQYLDAKHTLRDIDILWHKDFMRSVDYLCTRTDIDTQKIAFYGRSWGANMGPQALALEKRIKLGILILPGLSCWEGIPPEIHPTNFAPHVKVPILMINDEQDFLIPDGFGENPLLRLMGTPDSNKARKVYPGGHGIYGIFYQEIIGDIAAFLDKYLGPVEN